jgi:type IV secretory pathway TrbD component
MEALSVMLVVTLIIVGFYLWPLIKFSLTHKRVVWDVKGESHTLWLAKDDPLLKYHKIYHSRKKSS